MVRRGRRATEDFSGVLVEALLVPFFFFFFFGVSSLSYLKGVEGMRWRGGEVERGEGERGENKKEELEKRQGKGMLWT